MKEKTPWNMTLAEKERVRGKGVKEQIGTMFFWVTLAGVSRFCYAVLFLFLLGEGIQTGLLLVKLICWQTIRHLTNLAVVNLDIQAPGL